MALVGTFLVGQQVVAHGCYSDARCGTPLCGDAICGTWWVCPSQPGLGLGGIVPTVDISVPGAILPAGLGLGAYLPSISTTKVFSPAPAGLGLGGASPVLRLSTRLAPLPAALGLGTFAPERAGPLWMVPTVCTGLDLVPDPESDLVLVGAACTEITLEPTECL
jgi:hypothetical protein